MSFDARRRSVVGAVLVSAAIGCGGGSGKSGTPDGGGPDGGGAPDTGAVDGGGTDGGPGGADGGGQVLPPYRGRIVITPAALLFTDAGQTAKLHAQAFDAGGAPMDVSFTFASSRPDQVAVDASGNVTSMVSLGSSQISATGAGLASPPLLVLIVVPQPGTVLISDAQVVTGPAQVDPTADPLPGALYKVTLDNVDNLAPGTMLVSREGNTVAGQVVSTAPNGTHTDVVYELPTLLDLFARIDLHAGYDYDLQTAADDAAIAAMAPLPTAMAPPSAAPAGTAGDLSAFTFEDVMLGPFKCTPMVDPIGVKIDGNISVTPALHLAADFSKDENGDWTDAALVLSGDIKTTGKVIATVGTGAVASLSCKLKLGEFIPPIGGPIAILVGPRIEVGAKAEIKATAILSQLQLGGKIDETGHILLGISGGLHGPGALGDVTLDAPHLEPMFAVNDDLSSTAMVELSAAVGGYATLNLTALKFKIAEGFIGAKLKYQMMTLRNELGSATPNKYELKAPVREIGPGSDLKKVLSALGIALDFKIVVNDEGSVVAKSPFGTFTANNPMMDVPANKQITFTIQLDAASTRFLGQTNVNGVHIYRSEDPALVGDLKQYEIMYLAGAGPTFNWTYTPKLTEVGKVYLFWAAVDDEFISSIDFLGVTAPFYLGKLQIDVVPTTGNWGGTEMLTWKSISPPTVGGTSTETGSAMITYVPGMPSPDGISFDLVATKVTFTATYTMTRPDSLGAACPATETYTATSSFTKTGADADRDAHALLRVIPNGNDASYEFGFPILSGEADFTDDIVSEACGTSSHFMGLIGIGTSAGGKMATIAADATTITDGTTYMNDDGVSGETILYTGTWNLQKM